jgi:hypothetical protein
MIGLPPSGDGYLTKLAAIVREETSRREPILIGSRVSGTSWYLRFRAGLSVALVQVHVQSTVAGEGGTAAYDPANYTSSTEVECRSDRLQDREITGLAASEDYVVFLIPKQVASDGTTVQYDGQGGRPDNMSFAMVST